MSESKVYVKPREGIVVKDPETLAPLPAEGAWRPRTRYWLRRLADGSCVEATQPRGRAERKKPKSEG